MAKIQEELVLYDRFTQTFTRYIRLGEQAAGVTGQAKDATEQFARSQRTAERAAGSLTGAVRQLAGAYAGLRGAAALVGLSDQMAQTTARLDRMNDGLQTTAQLQDMIWQSAQRSRGLYADTAAFVSKLGTLAGDAFSSTAEIVAFAEQINKQLVLSGASTAEAQGALLQLTQGLSSGALRGEELNSVLEQTPMIAQTIAGYMGVTPSKMRELASEGKVTAAVVKNAMLSAAEETDAAFEEMPMTWGQVWSSFQNTAIVALQPVLDGVNLLANHMETVGPVFVGAAAAVGVYTAAMAVHNAVTWAGVAANQALVVSMLKNPFLWVAVGIGVAVAAAARWVQSVGGIEIAWLIAKDTVLTAWEELQYGAASLTNGIKNYFSDMGIDVLTTLQDMVNGAISAINWLISQANKIPGVSIAAIEAAEFGTNAAIRIRAAQQARMKEQTMMRSTFDLAQTARQAGIDRKRAELASGDNGTDGAYPWATYDDIATQLSGIGGDVSSIKKSVDLSKEDIKSLVDVAERRYVNNINLTAQTPIVTVNGANTGRTAADRRDLANAIRDILLEQRAAGGVRATSLPVQG